MSARPGPAAVRPVVLVLLFVVSLALSVPVTLEATSVLAFVSTTLLLGLIVFSTLGSLVLCVRHLIRGDRKTAASAAKAAGAIPIVALAGWVLLQPGLHVPISHYPRFRTNILTGRCDYAVPRTPGARNPWYYRDGCTIPRDAKIRLVKASRYPYYQALCTTHCKDDIARCPAVRPIVGEDIRCADLMP